MGKRWEYNEKAAWDELDETQKSFVVRVLNWFHFRPKRIAQSWIREEVLTWELFRALKVLPHRVFLSPLIERIGLRNLSCAGLTKHLQSAVGRIEIDAYPSLRLTGALHNRRSDIGLRHPDGTQLWLEAKTVFVKNRELLDLLLQLHDQQYALSRITSSGVSRVIALVPSVEVISGFPAINWSDILEVLGQAQSQLQTANNAARDMDGYLLIAQELHDRIRTHQNGIAV